MKTTRWLQMVLGFFFKSASPVVILDKVDFGCTTCGMGREENPCKKTVIIQNPDGTHSEVEVGELLRSNDGVFVPEGVQTLKLACSRHLTDEALIQNATEQGGGNPLVGLFILIVSIWGLAKLVKKFKSN